MEVTLRMLVIHVAGTHMAAKVADGLYIGLITEIFMTGEDNI